MFSLELTKHGHTQVKNLYEREPEQVDIRSMPFGNGVKVTPLPRRALMSIGV
jgi:hypothetical protein